MRIGGRAADIGLILMAVAITVLNSGFGKPLWIDEYLHFAMGSLSSREALEVIAASTGDGVSWGQTGVYLFVDYVLGSVFGANLWALRAPSIIAGLMLLLSAVWFLRTKGLNRVWQAIVLAALGGQVTLGYYVGEARPYLPMAASVVAVLAFYSTSIADRRSVLGRLLGFTALIVGAAFHPYWLPFTLVIIGFCMWVDRRAGNINRRADVRAFLSLPMLISGVVIYVVLAGLTWMSNARSMPADPWEFVGGPQGWVRTILSTHLDFVSPTHESFVSLDAFMPLSVGFTRVLALGLVGLATVLTLISRKWRPALVEPVVLLWIAVGSTVAISALSLINEYWIIQRQWLAGVALAPIAVVWALAKLWRTPAGSALPWAKGVAALAVGLIGAQFALAVSQGIDQVWNHSAAFASFHEAVGTPDEIVGVGDPVFAGNVNVARGGPIWREQARYYGVG